MIKCVERQTMGYLGWKGVLIYITNYMWPLAGRHEAVFLSYMPYSSAGPNTVTEFSYSKRIFHDMMLRSQTSRYTTLSTHAIRLYVQHMYSSRCSFEPYLNGKQSCLYDRI